MGRACDQFELTVSAYLDGELPRTEARALFFHLAECDQCSAFLDTVRTIERRALKERRMVASKHLDERIASFLPTDAAQTQGLTERLFRPPSSTREHGPVHAHTLHRKPASFASLARRSLLAAVVGFSLGVTQPWSYLLTPVGDPQIVYVPMLPDIPVIGQVNESDIGGTSK